MATIAPTVAMNVLAAVITSSPGCTPTACSARLSASVPELTPIACFAPMAPPNRPSNSATALPSVKSPECTSASMSASTAFTSMNWRSRYEYLTCMVSSPRVEVADRADDLARGVCGHADHAAKSVVYRAASRRLAAVQPAR